MPDQLFLTIVQTVYLAKPASPFQAAILEMIAILFINGSSFGREPDPHTCKFVEDTVERLLTSQKP